MSNRALWAFRGQADATWPLETTLYREAVRNGSIESRFLHHREEWLLYQFRRFAHHYRTDLPPEKDTLDWLALVQHYGGPTRLLDFSYSLYVSAFFAVESAVNDSAIWAVNLSTLELATCSRLEYSPAGSIVDWRHAHNEKFQEVIKEPIEQLAVIHVEPDQMHERLYIQQGLFLAPTNPNEPFMKNLSSSFRCRYPTKNGETERKWTRALDNRSYAEYGEKGYISVLKIILPLEWHREILEDLESMNISAATLFPGLEGFSRSLKFYV